MAKMVVFGHGQWHGWSMAKSWSKEMTVTDSPSMAGCSIKQTNKQKQNKQTNKQIIEITMNVNSQLGKKTCVLCNYENSDIQIIQNAQANKELEM